VDEAELMSMRRRSEKRPPVFQLCSVSGQSSPGWEDHWDVTVLGEKIPQNASSPSAEAKERAELGICYISL